MNDRKSNLPRKAVWLLQHVCPGDNEALTGDLIERFREGQTRGWFWRQVLMACAVGILTAIRRRWPYFCYAIAGTEIMGIPFFVEALNRASAVVPGLVEPWWVSALHSMAALPVLAAALLLNGAFRWVSLLRTWIINLTLLALPAYLIEATIGPYIMPLAVNILVFFSTFLVSAWLGCRSPRKAARAAKPS